MIQDNNKINHDAQSLQDERLLPYEYWIDLVKPKY